jgi:hypothetical protein
MERKKVKSSRIRAIGYDPKKETLEVEFMKGGIYQYSPIKKGIHLELINAQSIGVYFENNIRNNALVKVNKVG